MGLISGGCRSTAPWRSGGSGSDRGPRHLAVPAGVPVATRWSRAGLACVLLAAVVVVVPGLGDDPSSAAVSPGVTERVSVRPDGTQADAAAGTPSVSADGGSVVFASDSAMVAPDANAARGLEFGDQSDVYLRDRAGATTVLISQGFEQPTLACTPAALAFAAGGASQTVTCTASGGTIRLAGASVTGAFEITSTTCAAGDQLTDAQTCQVAVGFTGTATNQEYTGQLTVSASGGVPPASVALSGQGPPPGTLSCDPGTMPIILAAGSPPATRTVVCTAAGGEVDIDSIALQNPTPPDPDPTQRAFSLGAQNCFVASPLPAGGTCNIDVVFGGAAVGDYTVQLVVGSDATNAPTVVALSGRRNDVILTFRDGGLPLPGEGTVPRLQRRGATTVSGRIGRPLAGVRAGAPVQAVPTPVEANGASANPVISADGRWVAFESTATNLVANQGIVDPQGTDVDVFLHDRDADADGVLDEAGSTSTILISGGEASAGGGGTVPSISGDGQRIAFVSSFSGIPRVVLWDRTDPLVLTQLDMAGDYDLDAATEPSPDLETPTQSDQPSISDDGLHVAYRITYTSPPATEPQQAIVVRDVPADGTPGGVQRIDVEPDGDVLYPMSSATDPSISGDGAVVAFVAPKGTGVSQVVAVDRDLDGDGTFGFDPTRYDEWFAAISTTLAGDWGDQPSAQPAITADGRYVAFASMADLTGDPQGTCGASAVLPCAAILMRDLGAPAGSAIELVSAAVPVPVPVDDASGRPAVSTDGRFVAYDSLASNLIPWVEGADPPVGDTNDVQDVFVRELTPDLACAPDPADLGAAQVGDASGPFGITCTNTTFGPLQVSGLAFVGGDAARFSVVADGCTTTVVHQGGACFVSVRHQPTAVGPLQSTLRVRTDGGPARAVEDETLVVLGTGTRRPVPPPAIDTDPDAIDFGTRLLLSSTPRTVTVTNTGPEAGLAIPGVSIQPVGPDDVTGDYLVTGDTCSGTTLAPGASCTIEITFRPLPRALGGSPRPAVLVITDSAPGAPHLVTLTGRSQLPVVVVNPGVGRGGSVAFVLGTGFPASQPAVVAFDGFAESVLTTSDPSGTVEAPLLVMPRSTIGSRFVTVTVAGVTAGYQFLVEPGSVQVGNDTFLIRR